MNKPIENSLVGQPTGGKRIEYIDAMRGFTMLLVVMSHISFISMKTDTYSYNSLFATFRMPLFFFVSGFVLYKNQLRWTGRYIAEFLKKKLQVQIIAPTLFLIVFMVVRGETVHQVLIDYHKLGYWFTYTLFEFFVLYILVQKVQDWLRIAGYWRDACMLLVALALYFVTLYPFVHQIHMDEGVMAILGFPTWNYFLFFCIGTCVKKYFSTFERLLDTRYFTACLLVVFIIFSLPKGVAVWKQTLTTIVLALSGISLVFAYFRRQQRLFSSSGMLGRISQYVGRRTLDIYLIHYFFIYSDMHLLLPNFSGVYSPFIEFLYSASLGVLVVAACLLVSSVLRLSPVMAHYLFGQKI